MEPFSVLAIATAACQFLDFAAKVISGTWQIYNTSAGLDSKRNSHVRTITEDLTKLTDGIRKPMQTSSSQPLPPRDEAVLKLAERCGEVGTRLLAALDLLQKKPRSKGGQSWDSFVIALRTVWSQDSIDALKNDLRDYRQQMTIHLIVNQQASITSASHEQKQAVYEASDQQLQAIGGTAELCRRILEKVSSNTQHLNALAAIQQNYSTGAPGIMSATPSSKLHKIMHKVDTDQISRISQMVLHELHYREMAQRYERIALAHQKTFQWLFKPPKEPGKWSDFIKWIQCDDQTLYWITGKPGAGKSTLMRFIVDHPRTTELLNTWSRGQKLLTAFFFFWNSGSSMQMSYEGLVRSVMYQILKQAPHLIPLAFPHRVSDGVLFEQYIFRGQEWCWSWDELLEAFKILLQEATKENKIMIFIDGMDEFQGETSGLIDFVKRLVVPDVKVCASSRPWNQFQDAFGHGPHLRIEKLTAHDIEHFVSSRLASSAAYRSYEQCEPGFSVQMVEEVCEKSQGVFLWVHLVCKSLLDGLSDGEKPFELRTRLHDLPTDLEELFQKILAGVDVSHAERASAIFQIHRSWTKLPNLLDVNDPDYTMEGPLPNLLDMSFADEDQPDYAVRTACNPLTVQQKNARAELMNRRLNACTKGLLEADLRNVQEVWRAEISPLHRTVKDYLERRDIWESICATSPVSFSCDLRICTSYIMRLKIRQPLEFTGVAELWNITTRAAEYGSKVRKVNAPMAIQLLNALDQAHATVANSALFDANKLAGLIQTDLKMSREVCRSTLGTAIYCNTFTYVRQKLAVLTRDERSLVASECLRIVVAEDDHTQKDIRQTMRRRVPNQQFSSFLLQQGADPNYKAKGDKCSAWDILLLRPLRVSEWSVRDSRGIPEDVREYHILVEDFIRFGADPWNSSLAFCLTRIPVETTQTEALVEQKKKERPKPQHQNKKQEQRKSRFRVRFSSKPRT